MSEFLTRLKQRKLVQWAIAYVAFGFALLQGVDIVAQRFHWPDSVERYLILALALGFCVMLLIAWYHGERGAQRVGSMEIMLLALLLAIGGVLIWHFGPGMNTRVAPASAVASHAMSPTHPAATAARVSSGAAVTAPVPAIPAKSIAVLPFENLSADKNNAYFADGIQDLILTKLADIGGLKVIARTSTAKYASHPDDVQTIGRQLGVAAILEGSVQKQGNEVLINVQLIDTRTDAHLWAKAYTRTLTNVFGVEGEVAGKIAAALKATLSPEESARLAAVPTTNRAAYNAFLRAEYQASEAFTNQNTASMKAAITLYRQAVQADPKFALAWAKLSRNESLLAWFGGGGWSPRHLDRQARADAEQALQLAPDLAAARIALGYTEYYGRLDFPAALETFTAALKLKPNDADAVAARGYVLRRMGRFEDAIASLRRALVLDPRNSAVAMGLGRTYMLDQRYPEAEQAFQRALAIDPHNAKAQSEDALAIVLDTGDIPRALEAVPGSDPFSKLSRMHLLSEQRKYRKALALLDSIPDTPDNFRVGNSKIAHQANLYRLLGDTAKARALYAQDLPQARAQLEVQQGSNVVHAWHGIAADELGLGHTVQGLAAIAKARSLEQSMDVVYAASFTVTDADLYAQARRPDLAVPLLARALAMPGIGYIYSPVLLWLDPDWDPIRKDPRFQALLEQYAKYKPAVIPAIPSSATTTGGAAHD